MLAYLLAMGSRFALHCCHGCLISEEWKKYLHHNFTADLSDARAVSVSDKEPKESRRNILYQLIFMSPESLFCNLDWRRMLSTELYMKNLIAFIVDEADCVTKWKMK